MAKATNPSDQTGMPDEAAFKLAALAATKLTALFYKTQDFSKRDNKDMQDFFMENVKLLWCGNSVEGKRAVAEYFSNLPSTSSTVHSVSSQPVADSLSAGQKLILVNVTGIIKFSGHSEGPFSESFFLAQDNSLWKIQSICFRLFEV